ncbi:hypothetical protein, partial [Klebsiella pneumoniae]|uniref:hypothetical protein n=1 Tax=Klebsiella pneumoniae TaxID=573 RepID=UPI0025A029AD
HDCYFAFYPESESLLNDKKKRDEVSKLEDKDVVNNDPFVPLSKKRQREDAVKPAIPVVDKNKYNFRSKNELRYQHSLLIMQRALLN